MSFPDELAKAYQVAEAKFAKRARETSSVRLICPRVDIAPAESDFAIMTINTLKELLGLEDRPRVIGAFDVEIEEHRRLLDMVSEYSELFDFELVVLTDVPGALYTPEFYKHTTAFKSTSFVKLVEDLLDAAARDKLEKEQNANKHQGEIAQATRDSGYVRGFTHFEKPMGMFDVPATTDDVVEDDAYEG